MLGGIVKETRAHPYTMLVLVGLMVAVPYTMANYAKAGDLQALALQVQEVQLTVERSALEQQLRAINSELFDLRQKVAAILDSKKSPDRIYYDRISALENDREGVQRALARLAR